MKGLEEGVIAVFGLVFIVLVAGFALYSVYSNSPSVPVTGQVVSGGCVVSGCSGQVCDDHDVTTTCEYKPEYRCYASAKCERQGDGKCGWTSTPELQRCVATGGRA